MTDEPVLRPEEIEGVLAGSVVGGGLPGSGPEDEPQPYSLREPVSIPPERQAAARARLEEVVSALDDVLRSEADGAIEVTLDGLQQQTAVAALSVLPPPVWVASLAGREGGGVSLALHSAIGIALVDSTLGGTCTCPDSGREPTSLEARILSRLVATAADSIGRLLKRELFSVGLEVGTLPPSVAAPGEPVAVGLLRFNVGERDFASLLLVSSSLLLPAQAVAAVHETPGPLADRLESVVVEARPVLGAGRVSLKELKALRQGKLLCLDARADETFDLRVGASTIARGLIVRSPEQVVFTVTQKSGHVDPEGSEES